VVAAELPRVVQLACRERRRTRRDRHRPVAQHVVRDGEQKGGIDAARKRDGDGARRRQVAPERVELSVSGHPPAP